MTTPQLPFTLTPLPGESFDSWLEAYAARLQVSVGELADTIGLPGQCLRLSVRQLLNREPGDYLPAVAATTGLGIATLTAMFHPRRPRPSTRHPAAEHIYRAWRPKFGSSYCPACLAANAGRFALAWRHPWAFLCLEHNQVLATACPRCGRAPRARLRATRDWTAPYRCCPTPRRHTLTACEQDLSATPPPAIDGVAAARAAQMFINTLLTDTHACDVDSSRRRAAVEALTDLTVIALHLAGPTSRHAKPRRVQPRMLHAGTLAAAVAILTGADHPHGDPLAALVGKHATGPGARGVPETWRAASPTLITRITHRRDTSMTPLQRIRYASTLPQPTPPIHLPEDPDPAIRRAARLPDQLWSAWVVRLLADDTLDPTLLRQAVAVALLLPHSALTVGAATALLTNQMTRFVVAHQIRVLAQTSAGADALRVITQLALAIDEHHTPIDYQRRRRLAATTELLDTATWQRLAREHQPRGNRRRLGFARRYLYELLTAGSLAIAPAPFHLPPGHIRVEYYEFVLGLPAGLVAALTDHANKLLARAGITNEPVQWQPPADWVTVEDWPGVDPDHTDPAPIHQALLNHTPVSRIAKQLGLSAEHLRHVVRSNPLPDRHQRPVRRGAIRPAAPSSPVHTTSAGVHYVDPGWLSQQYLTWQRTLRDIAEEIGCTEASLLLFAKQHGISLRPRGDRAFIGYGAAPHHPADLPDLLRAALAGRDARQRVERFLTIAQHGSLVRAAETARTRASILSSQLSILERLCGGPLIHRGAPKLGDLTPLGRLLQQQAQQHLLTTKPAPP